MYASPTDATFPALAPLKREPELNYNAMPEQLFSSDQSGFGSG